MNKIRLVENTDFSNVFRNLKGILSGIGKINGENTFAMSVDIVVPTKEANVIIQLTVNKIEGCIDVYPIGKDKTLNTYKCLNEFTDILYTKIKGGDLISVADLIIGDEQTIKQPNLNTSQEFTSDKISKIKEIDELLKSGTITKDEFDRLKEEILNNQPQKPVEQKVIQEKVVKEVIEKKLDGFAVATFLLGLAGFFSMGETQSKWTIGMGFLAWCISWARSDRPHKGKGFRIAGIILVLLNIGWYIYTTDPWDAW